MADENRVQTEGVLLDAKGIPIKLTPDKAPGVRPGRPPEQPTETQVVPAFPSEPEPATEPTWQEKAGQALGTAARPIKPLLDRLRTSPPATDRPEPPSRATTPRPGRQ